MPEQHIVAMGGGGFSMEPENPLLDEFVLSLARTSRPRVCFLPTASGDSVDYTVRFYRAFSAFDCSRYFVASATKSSSRAAWCFARWAVPSVGALWRFWTFLWSGMTWRGGRSTCQDDHSGTRAARSLVTRPHNRGPREHKGQRRRIGLGDRVVGVLSRVVAAGRDRRRAD